MLREKGIGGRVANSHVPVARRKLQSYDRHCKRSLYPRRPKRGLGVEGGSGFSSAVDMKEVRSRGERENLGGENNFSDEEWTWNQVPNASKISDISSRIPTDVSVPPVHFAKRKTRGKE